jgi:hypothetical protein
MRPKTFTVTGVGTSPTIPLDWRSHNFQCSIQCDVTGTATYTIQHTLNDPFGSDPINWLDNSGVKAKSESTDGNYILPVRAIRLNVTSGTGTVKMTVVQP